MKRLHLIICLFVTAWTTASAYDFMVDGIAYNKNKDGKSVTLTYTTRSTPTESNFSTYEGDFVIPSTVVNNDVIYDVTAIGDYAFRYCTALTGITIPNTVTSIGDIAFGNCSGLTSVSIPGSVTNIGENPFFACTSLKEFIVDNDNTYFSSFEGVLFNKDITTLIAFPCAKTQSYNIPSGVNKISNRAFQYSDLEIVNLPNSLDSIGTYAFAVSNLHSITIPENVTYIGGGAFWYCSKLTTVNYNAINCETPTASLVNQSYSTATCFALNPLTTLNFGENVKVIPHYLAYMMKDLTSISIPESVEEIGERAFGGSGLTEVTLPCNVKSIGNMGFWQCEHLEKVKSLAQQPPTCSSDTRIATFKSINPNCILYVPKGCFKVYALAKGWAGFFVDIIEIEEEPEVLKGDVNRDGYVNTSDITVLQNKILGIESQPFYENNADMNDDGVFDISDITLIINCILNRQ